MTSQPLYPYHSTCKFQVCHQRLLCYQIWKDLDIDCKADCSCHRLMDSKAHCLESILESIL